MHGSQSFKQGVVMRVILSMVCCSYLSGVSGLAPPSGLMFVTSLQSLLLNDNGLSGQLPSGWSSLTGLTRLLLQGNALQGTLPPSWSALTGLKVRHTGHHNYGFLAHCMALLMPIDHRRRPLMACWEPG